MRVVPHRSAFFRAARGRRPPGVTAMPASTDSIARVAVVGAGTMGAQIAAHLANCGVSSSLLDTLPAELAAEEQARGLTLESPAVRSRVARAGLERVRGLRPPPFYDPAAADLITCGNT